SIETLDRSLGSALAHTTGMWAHSARTHLNKSNILDSSKRTVQHMRCRELASRLATAASNVSASITSTSSCNAVRNSSRALERVASSTRGLLADLFRDWAT